MKIEEKKSFLVLFGSPFFYKETSHHPSINHVRKLKRNSEECKENLSIFHCDKCKILISMKKFFDHFSTIEHRFHSFFPN